MADAGAPPHRVRWGLTLMTIAAASAIAVSVIYLPQSMMTEVARDLGVSATAASAIATAVQIGYAVGIFLLVPLGDRIAPRRQVSVQAVALAVALVASALMPTLVSVAACFVCVGLVANIAQILIPAANRMAPGGRQATTNGTIAGALMVGIFGGRILASFLVESIGWRWVVVIFAGCVLTVVPFLRRVLPVGQAECGGARSSYPALLRSTAQLLGGSPVLAQSAAIQFVSFGIFTTLWTVMVLHLTGPELGWSITQAGLFGFVGLAAGVITPMSGHLIDRFGNVRATGAGLATILTATLLVMLAPMNIAAFASAMFMVTLANQSLQTATQSRVLNANPHNQAQANTVYMMCVFAGGSTGAILGPVAFEISGMVLVAGLAACLGAIGCAVWAVGCRRSTRRNMGG